MIKKQKISIKNINIGIELLRMIFCFLIVVYHLHSNEKKSYIMNLSLCCLGFYTSTFFLISFYFSFRCLSSNNIIILKERLRRIILPYVIWPIIIFLEKNIIKYKYSNKFPYSIKHLILQLVVGRNINDVFWFQFNLIFISIIIIIISLIFQKNISFYIFICIFLFAVYFNFKGFDKAIFSSYNKNISHSVGRISYSIIYSITGFLLGSFNLLNLIKQKHKKIILLFFPFLLYILREHNKIILITPKFYFIIIDIIIIFLFIFFSSIHLDSVMNINFIMIIKRITSFTGGIYYLHLFIFDIFYSFTDLIRKRDAKSCIIIYFLCYLICFIFSNIFKQSRLKYLFI